MVRTESMVRSNSVSRGQQYLVDAQGRTVTQPVSLMEVSLGSGGATYTCNRISPSKYCFTTANNPPSAALVQSEQECFNSCLNLTEGYQSNPGKIMLRESNGILADCRCCTGDKIPQDLYKSLGAKAEDTGNDVTVEGDTKKCSVSLKDCKEKCNAAAGCKSFVHDPGAQCCEFKDKCLTKNSKKADANAQDGTITYYKPCSAEVSNGAPGNQAGWVQFQCSGKDPWGSTNLWKPPAAYFWQDLNSSTATNVGGSVVIYGSLEVNLRLSFETCKNLCRDTPSCMYVHYCDYGSHGLTGQCWGYSSLCVPGYSSCTARPAVKCDAPRNSIRRPSMDTTWTAMPDSGDYTRGDLAINGYANKVSSWDECKALCEITPTCKYVHYCDTGSGGRTGECWGTVDHMDDGDTPKASGCAATKNAYYSAGSPVQDPFKNNIGQRITDALA